MAALAAVSSSVLASGPVSKWVSASSFTSRPVIGLPTLHKVQINCSAKSDQASDNVYSQVTASAIVSARRLASSILSFSHPSPHGMDAIQSLKNSLSLSVAPLCFAAISHSASVSTPLTVVASGMAKWLELYSGVLMVRVLLSWFPNIPWERQPLQAIRDMCDPYLNLFRNIIPPLFNALDLSPLLAFLVLGMLASILNTTIQT